MSIEAKADLSVVFDGLDKLGSSIKYSLARSMAVAGGKVVRDEARARAPRRDMSTLANAIYLAYRDGLSTEARVVYSVTWNSRKAPHGHLIEFGHWRINKVERQPDGTWLFSRERLPEPVWVPAHSFLRPALDATRGTMVQAMIQRGRERLPELLQEVSASASSKST